MFGKKSFYLAEHVRYVFFSKFLIFLLRLARLPIFRAKLKQTKQLIDCGLVYLLTHEYCIVN